MDPREQLADNLEFWSGRDRFGDMGEDLDRRGPARARPAPRRSSSRRRRSRVDFVRDWLPGLAGWRRRSDHGRARPIAAAALLAALTASWLAVGHRSHPSAVADATAAFTVPDAPPAAAAPANGGPATARPTTRPPAGGCRGLSSARRAVRCVVDGIALDVQRFAASTIAAEYRRVAGDEVAPGSGPPVCAQGVPEERTWSLASAPSVPVGRYRCGIEDGRAVMWWTRGVELFHAVASDGDLGALFAWWRAHPSQ